MDEFGENLDLCVIGGYYGKGARGSKIASFLCGLRVDDNKFWSFCKVGGGFTAGDRREIHQRTDGKWHEYGKYDAKDPPSAYMDIGRPKELPNVWIKPSDSLVFEVKAAQIIPTTDFRSVQTLRFPRFRGIRHNKSWKDSLSLTEFNALQTEVNKAISDKAKVTITQKKRKVTRRPKTRLLEDPNKVNLSTVAIKDDVFNNQVFFVADDVSSPRFLTKSELQAIIKENGGKIVQSGTVPSAIVIADRNLPEVAGIIRRQSKDVIKPTWIFDCIAARRMLPLEQDDLFYGLPETEQYISANADKYGDSYKRDVNVERLADILQSIPAGDVEDLNNLEVKELMIDLIDAGSGPFRGVLFPKDVFYFDRPSLAEKNGLSSDRTNIKKVRIEDDFNYIQKYGEFNGAVIGDNIHDMTLTHVIVHSGDKSRVGAIRSLISVRGQNIRVVDWSWVLRCWEEKTSLAVENFQV